MLESMVGDKQSNLSAVAVETGGPASSLTPEALASPPPEKAGGLTESVANAAAAAAAAGTAAV